MRVFKNSEEISWLRKLYANSLEGKYQASFNTSKEAFEHLVNTPYRTMLSSMESVPLEVPEFRCDIVPAWIRRTGMVSFAFAKNSPYTKLVNYNLLKHVESGLVELLYKRFTNNLLECEQDQEREPSDMGLTFYKLISLFGIVGGGFALALLLLVLEALHACLKDRGQALASASSRDEFDLFGCGLSAYEREVTRMTLKWSMGQYGDFLSDMEAVMKLKGAASEAGGEPWPKTQFISVKRGCSAKKV